MQETWTLYHTEGCHLCEDAEAIVMPLMQAQGLILQRVDIAFDDDLLARYGTRIPVLQKDAEHELDWPFDAQSVVNLLTLQS